MRLILLEYCPATGIQGAWICCDAVPVAWACGGRCSGWLLHPVLHGSDESGAEIRNGSSDRAIRLTSQVSKVDLELGMPPGLPCLCLFSERKHPVHTPSL